MTYTVYLDTSIIRSVTDQASAQAITRACQELTLLWWTHERDLQLIYTSSYVTDEIQRGEPLAAARQLTAVELHRLLPADQKIPMLAEFLVGGGGLPASAMTQALHIACASFYCVDVLATWNCTVIAHPGKMALIRTLCDACGHQMPELVTPFQLMENNHGL